MLYKIHAVATRIRVLEKSAANMLIHLLLVFFNIRTDKIAEMQKENEMIKKFSTKPPYILIDSITSSRICFNPS